MTGRSCFWEVQDEDGKGIVMRREGLREGTKRAAERESHKLKARLSPGEKRNRKRMATVAAVYSIERQVRTPESVMGGKSEEDAPQPRARNKRVWASVERSPEQVTEEVFQEALRRDPNRERPWLMLVDGHEEQLGQIRGAIDRHGVEVTLVLDFSTCSNTSGRPRGVSSSPGARRWKPGSASGPYRS